MAISQGIGLVELMKKIVWFTLQMRKRLRYLPAERITVISELCVTVFLVSRLWRIHDLASSGI